MLAIVQFSRYICRSFKQCKVVRDIKGHPLAIGGRDIEQVDSFSHLGHIITSDFSDTEDIIDVTDLWDCFVFSIN